MPDNPVLYYRTDSTKTTPIDDLPDEQKIIFDGSRTLETITTTGTGNIVVEPEFSPSGEKSYHKQEVGGISENLRLTGNIEISENPSIDKLRSFSRMKQLDETNFIFGVIGFYNNLFPHYNLDPNNTQGYSMDTQTLSFGSNVKSVKFDVILSLGGKNLT